MPAIRYRDPRTGQTLPVVTPGDGTGGVTDHGALTGLADDDHPQYHNDVRGDARYSPVGHGHAHGSLSGLTADDHPQYLPLTGGRPMTGDLMITKGSPSVFMNGTGGAIHCQPNNTSMYFMDSVTYLVDYGWATGWTYFLCKTPGINDHGNCAATKDYCDANHNKAASGDWRYAASMLPPTGWSCPRPAGTPSYSNGFAVTANGALTSTLGYSVLATATVQAENLNANTAAKFGLGWGRTAGLDYYMSIQPLSAGETTMIVNSRTVKIDPGVTYGMWVYCSIPMDVHEFAFNVTAVGRV